MTGITRASAPALALLLLLPSVAAAQGPATPVASGPLPWVVVDVRGAWPSIGDDALTAEGLGVAQDELPGRALTGVAAVHVYPLRQGRFKVGLGGEVLMGRGSQQKRDADGKPAGPRVTRELEGVSGQISLNFGRAAGWSYVTAGTGPLRFDSFLDDATPDGRRRSTLNVGGGARWFNWKHLGLTVDLRFYRTKAAEATTTTAARGPKRFVIISGGITFK